MRIRIEDYLRLSYRRCGRTRPAVDCWGLYRLIVGEASGIWLEEFSGLEDSASIADTTAREAASPEWLTVMPGAERPGDAVLMSGLLRDGRNATSAPIHIGCVVVQGRVIHIEARGGVKVQTFRGTSTRRAMPSVSNRVRGIFRPRALA